MGDGGDGENNKNYCPIYHKYMLTVEEASIYFGIGQTSLREWIKNNFSSECLFIVGKKVLIKRKLFDTYMEQLTHI